MRLQVHPQEGFLLESLARRRIGQQLLAEGLQSARYFSLTIIHQVVYLVYDRQGKVACALKTFREELLADAAAREAFKKEALLWVNLEAHPFIRYGFDTPKLASALFGFVNSYF